MAEPGVTEAFHRLYYDTSVWKDTYWLGVPTQKCPLDLWIYQEILHEVKPDLIIETGTAHGGSAYYLASLMDLVGRGEVVTVDIHPIEGRPAHPRITYVTGSSTADEVVQEVERLAEGHERVLVILDSDHSRDHVLDELRIYNRFVTPSSYLIVEDTNVNGHPVLPEHGPGPREALDDFLAETDGLEVDTSREKFFMTFNPRGFLRKRA
ncbi:MAG: CmcI family methyltransferase [Actinomycetota bacterium]